MMSASVLVYVPAEGPAPILHAVWLLKAVTSVCRAGPLSAGTLALLWPSETLHDPALNSVLDRHTHIHKHKLNVSNCVEAVDSNFTYKFTVFHQERVHISSANKQSLLYIKKCNQLQYTYLYVWCKCLKCKCTYMIHIAYPRQHLHILVI